ncbi:hypothetical protein Tco_0408298 [Tanacetum coccineum]
MERNRMKTQHLAYQYVETASESAATSSEVNSDDVTTTCDAVMITDSKEAFRRFGGPTELIENLALYDHKSLNDPRDLAKPVKAISLPQDVSSTSDRHLIELENQVQRLMEAYLAPKPSVQVNKIASSYARLSKFEANFKQQQTKMTNKIDTLLKAINDRMTGALLSDTVKNPKLNVSPTFLVFVLLVLPLKRSSKFISSL